MKDYAAGLVAWSEHVVYLLAVSSVVPRKSKLRYAAIDDQFRSGHEAGIVAREEQGCPGDFPGLICYSAALAAFSISAETAVAYGAHRRRKSDTLDEVLAAPDRDEVLDGY